MNDCRTDGGKNEYEKIVFERPNQKYISVVMMSSSIVYYFVSVFVF